MGVSETLFLVVVLTTLVTVSGQNCTEECQNDGICKPIPNEPTSFKCYCGTLFYGEYCQFHIGCKDAQCLNGASCQNKDGGKDFECVCALGYEGRLCQEVDLCKLKNPNCMNQGVCRLKRVGNEMKTRCKCIKPFFGERCEYGCSNVTCGANGFCEKTENGTKCSCKEGFTGEGCQVEEKTTTVTEVPKNGNTTQMPKKEDQEYDDDFYPQMEQRHKTSPCAGNFCTNNSTCIPIQNGTTLYTCNCTSDFDGQFCEDPTDCRDFKCFNNGSCVHKNETHPTHCSCTEAYSGKYCQEADFCKLYPPNCVNGGICSLKRVGGEMKTKCKCLKEFRGERCELINNCLNVTCGHGKCENVGNTTKCQCQVGYEGSACEIENHCITTFPQKCLNSGKCVKGQTNSTKYTCACATGYTGYDCEIVEPTTPYGHAIPFQCFDLKCLNGGSCVPDPTQKFGSKCYCGQDYYGNVCQYPTVCKGIQCMNNGTCRASNDSGKDFQCDCPKGYSGKLCNERDLCILSNLNCSKNSECSLRRNGTEIQAWCKCVRGHFGRHPNCSRNPCYFENDCENGLCKRLDDFQHNCTCRAGYFGPKCQFSYACLANDTICLNSGECKPNRFGNSTVCDCPGKFTGPRCEKELKRERPITRHRKYPQKCKPNSCNYQGQCTDAISSTTTVTCKCNVNYTGQFCDIENPCFKNKTICLHGGRCKPNRFWNSTVCDCSRNFTGPRCEKEVKRQRPEKRQKLLQKCEPDSCNGNGNCSAVTGSNNTFINVTTTRNNTFTNVTASNQTFTCICNRGFEGDSCEIEVNATKRKAESGGGSFSCHCKRGLFGPKCDQKDINLLEDNRIIIPYVVVGCLVAYIIFFMILAIRDRHNHVSRPKVIIMCDIMNLREETFYLILVETGNNFLAGSTANVCCQLYGEKGRSKAYVLSDENLDTTRQNGYDTFLVSSKKYLGRLEKIRIWHDNFGHTASWYCRQVIVRDIKTDEFWIFFIHRWLTIFMDRESLICRKLVATSSEVDQYLKNRFTLSRYWQRMREHHVWMCPLTCPPRSTYLRIERLTCATVVLFICMLILIFLFGTPAKDSTAYMAEFGECGLEGYPLWAAFIAAIIILLLGFIIVCLFRRVRKKRIPVIVVSDRTKELESGPEVKPRKVTKQIDEIYRKQTDIYETDSESEIGRWDNLDPDRVMVVGIPVDPETKKSGSPPPLPSPPPRPRPVVPVLATPSSTHFFSIPSTDMLQTERWISEVMDRTHGEPKSDDFVRAVEPDKNRIPGWKQVIDLGLIAQVNEMRNEDPSSFTYQSSEPIDDLIRDSIRDEYEDGDGYEGGDSDGEDETENIESSAPVELQQGPEEIALTGGGEMVQPSLSKVNAILPSVRHAKIQTDAYIESNAEPLPKFFQQHGSIDDDPEYPPPKEDPSETDLLRKKSSVVTVKQFVNPRKFSVELGEIDYDYENRRMIPRKYIWIPWLVCILIILICAVVTIIYGFRYSYVRSLDWCISLILAVIISIVILQPLVILVIFLATSYIDRKHRRMSREERRIFNKLKLIWITGSRGALKIWPLNYITYIPTFSQPPLSGAEIFMNKLKVRRKAKIRRSLIDFIVYSVFIILVILAGILSRDNLFYQNKRTVEDILLLENETYVMLNQDAFTNIRDDREYMSNVFIPSVHLEGGSRRRRRALTVSNTTKNNRVNVLLGVPRIRQLRVSPAAHNCSVNDTFRDFRPYCKQDFYDDWDYSNKDTEDYSEGWRKNNVVPRISSGRNDFWKFHGAEESQSTDTVGELNTYDGSGYIVELARTPSTSLDILNETERTKWIDERTRAILVEFSMYNPNLNFHSVVILLLEKASSLQYITSSQVLTWRFEDLSVSTPVLFFSIFIFSLCLLHFFIFTVVSSIKSFRQIGFSALRRFLLWTDICIITIGITAIWNHFVNTALLNSKFTELRAAPDNVYVSFQVEEERQERQVRFFSILTALGIIKLWYLLVVSSRIFFIIGFTFSITGPFIMGCILIFNISLLGFCTGARIVFAELRNYRTVGIAFLTQTYHAGLRNVMPYYEFVEEAPVVGRLFYFAFTVFIVLLFINVMASVITLGMQEAKETSLQRPFRFSYFNYIWLKLQLIIPNSIRKKFESRYNDTVLTQEREDQMERTLIPILWNHIYSIPVRRIQEMKSIVEELVEDSDLMVVSKKEKEMAKKLKILKIEEGRVNRMRELSVRYIKDKLKIDFEAPELAGYNKFNFRVLQLKCKKLDKKMNDLDAIVGKHNLHKLKYLQSNKSRPRGSSGASGGRAGGPWESESEANATARLK